MHGEGTRRRLAVPERLMRPERLQIMLDPDELAAIDDFRFHSRMPSRAAAVRELLRRGLAAEGFVTAPARTHSQHFGVLDPDDRPGAVGEAGGIRPNRNRRSK